MTPTPHLRSAPASTALFIAAFALSGCVEPEAMTCPTGIYCPAGSRCAARQAACIFDDCGDGVVQAGEMCDDGNKLDGDGCSADCKSNETCGNGVVDVAMGELCDDGNKVDSDGCSADCRSVEGCGNGIVDPGEECDAGPSGVPNVAEETPACDSNCTWARHGDGVVNVSAGELCDGDNGRTCESSACNYDCTLSTCGDGVKNALAGEACDEGLNNSDTGGCLLSCQANACGDTHVNQAPDQFGNPKEECDEGTANSWTGNCLPTCKPNVCGDTHVNHMLDQSGNPKETCDDGPGGVSVKIACDYGQQSCTLCSACQWVPLTGPYCGDPIQQANEACDDGDNNGATACSYGTQSCTICNGTCTERVQRRGPYCGDRVENGDEVCDDGADNGKTSCPYGQQTCLICDSTCSQLVPRRGPYCGNYQLDTAYSETCDNRISFACGSCRSADTAGACTWAATPGELPNALGSLVVASMTNLTGVTFTVNDGRSADRPKTFEFTSGNTAQSGNVGIDISGSADAAAVAQAVATAVGNGTVLTASPAGSTVSLTNNRAGVFGNKAITVTPAGATAFTATGMEGGLGCPPGQACNYDRDCVSETCRSQTCE